MKAISPVIATVIIVAVAIAISIAVALWITGLTSSFTGVEKLEIVNAYAVSSNGWDVYVLVKNTGTKTATVDQIFINNQPYSTDSISYTTANTPPPTDSAKQNQFNGNVIINTGNYALFLIHLPSSKYTSGQTISIIIHTASGGQYPATVTLP